MKALHDAVDAAVSEPVDGVLLLQRVQARRFSVRRRRLAIAGALVSACTVVVVASFLASSAPTQPTRPEPVPTTQTVSYRGVQVTVPASWILGADRCGTAITDTVLVPRDYLGNLCGAPLPPTATWVLFRGATYDTDQTKTTISGTAALEQLKSFPKATHPFTFGTITIPAANVTVMVQGPDPARVRALLSTVRRIAVDENGCPTKFQDKPLPARASAADALLPDAPVSVSVCRYDHYRIERSVRLSADELGPLQRASNDLVPGTTRPLSLSGCPAQIGGIYVLHAHYASGPDVQVMTRPFSCDGRSPTNGTRTTVLTVPYIGILNDTLNGVLPYPRGTVTGTLEVVGGPAPGLAHGLAGTITFTRGGTTTSTTSSPNGQFRLILPPGTYTVSGPCGSPVRVGVRAAGAHGVTLICSVR